MTFVREQLPMGFLKSETNTPRTADPVVPRKRWLGLATHNRRLFDALQDGWLRPIPSSPGLLLGVEAYADEQDTDRGSHTISVWIKLDVEKLPSLRMPALRGGQWTSLALGATEPSDEALYWLGPLPTFAISELAVATEEERVRLTVLARQFSNVKLLDELVIVEVDPTMAEVAEMPPLPQDAGADRFVIPPEVDAMQGAMTMAVWAVPRIEPWLDILVASLSPDRDQLPNLAAGLKAGWLQFPPWLQPPDNLPQLDLQTSLWLAAMDVFKERPDSPAPPAETAQKIAAASLRYESKYENEISAWLRTTLGILRAESTFQFGNSEASAVGTAIQLVLARLQPTRFKTWYDDRPDLPPSVWWPAAVLCGLHHGYRKLDNPFRGNIAAQREFIAVHAMRTHSGKEITWPSFEGHPHWRREANTFTLLWGGKEIARMSANERGKWYAANFDNMEVKRSAMRVARDLGWPSCCSRRINLPKGSRVPFSGPIKIRNGELDIQGAVTLRLPADQAIEEVLEVDSFRHHVAVAAGTLPEPPQPQTPFLAVEKRAVPEIPGLIYLPDFLDPNEEQDIVAEIDQGAWSMELKRRVQHYGWRYDYKSRQVDPAMRLGALPEWADVLARRLFERGVVPNLPDQLIVNEYVEKQGISKHVDAESSFADGIAMISLLESWEMLFREMAGRRKVNQLLERRSVVVITGDARYRWTHEIPGRMNELVPRKTNGVEKRKRVRRKRRLSLTFRKVLV